MLQVIKTDSGEELVVLSRREYDALRARAGDDAAEDAMAARLIEEAKGQRKVPDWLAATAFSDKSVMQAAREHAGKTQAFMAEALGISQGYYSQLENGTKHGTPDVLKEIAKLLKVDVALLRADD